MGPPKEKEMRGAGQALKINTYVHSLCSVGFDLHAFRSDLSPVVHLGGRRVCCRSLRGRRSCLADLKVRLAD